MLLDLKVSDFAIIENIHIEFTKGFNVLSGETGAGKSVLLKSLGLLMGGKALSDSVRTGCSAASIEGYFDLSDRPDIVERLQQSGINVDEDTLIVRRLISAQGKSKVYLNGSLVTLTDLREVVSPLIEMTGEQAPLIEMTGQHDNKHLQNKAYHLELLDHSLGLHEQRKAYQAAHNEVKSLQQQIDDLQGDTQDKAQRLDFLKYQLEEIENLNLKPGEEEELEQRVQKMKSSSRLSDFVQTAEDALYGDDDAAITRIERVRHQAIDLVKYDPELEKQNHLLEQAKAHLEDWLYFLQSYSSGLDADADNIDALESQLSRLRKLQNKYGASVEEILSHFEDIKQEIHDLENKDLVIKEKQKQLKALELKRKALATELHELRVKGAKNLQKSVNEELKDLNMKGLMFSVQVGLSNEYTQHGSSDVEFMTRTSKSDKPRPLAKFASGGELSRILLAIKQVVGSGGQPRTYLFDEVDTGVSGETAEKVGRKLHGISEGQQVICVTHLPQVAAFADTHFLIEKSPKKNAVQMNVVELDKKSRVDEVARLISGEKITKTSLQHAKQLIQQSH